MKRGIKVIVLMSSFSFLSVANAKMGDECPTGELAFYGEMIRTGSEEKLCLTDNSSGIFYTKTSGAEDYVSFKTTDVVRKESKGEEGSTVGYRFTLSGADAISFKGFFQNGFNAPIMVYLDVNDSITEIDPNTAKIK